MDHFAFGSLVEFLAGRREPPARNPGAAPAAELFADPAAAAFDACAESLEELSRHISDPAHRAELLAGADQLRARRSGAQGRV